MAQNTPQYQLDLEGLAGMPEADVISYDQQGVFLGTHDTNLFDQDEDGSGNMFDEATGERYNNSASDDFDELAFIAVPGSRRHTDVLSRLHDHDEAEAWLKSHRPARRVPIATVVEVDFAKLDIITSTEVA